MLKNGRENLRAFLREGENREEQNREEENADYHGISPALQRRSRETMMEII